MKVLLVSVGFLCALCFALPAAAVEREHESYCSINPEAWHCRRRAPEPRFAQSKDIRIDWQYQGEWHSIEFSEGAHRDCQEAYVRRKHAYYSQPPHKYVLDDPCLEGIRFLARELRERADREGFDRKERIEFALNFVRGIPYQYDGQSTSKSDYSRYGYETVLDGAGDCEDHAILFASLLRAMCIRSYLIHLVGDHIVVGVSEEVLGTACPGTGYRFSHETICYCEPTSCLGGWCGETTVGQLLPFESDKENPYNARWFTPVIPDCFARVEQGRPKPATEAARKTPRELIWFEHKEFDPGRFRDTDPER